MLPRLLELLVFGVLPFVVGSVAASGPSLASDDDVVVEEKLDTRDQSVVRDAGSSGVVIEFPTPDKR